jgi:hypothetical protein
MYRYVSAKVWFGLVLTLKLVSFNCHCGTGIIAGKGKHSACFSTPQNVFGTTSQKLGAHDSYMSSKVHQFWIIYNLVLLALVFLL